MEFARLKAEDDHPGVSGDDKRMKSGSEGDDTAGQETEGEETEGEPGGEEGVKKKPHKKTKETKKKKAKGKEKDDHPVKEDFPHPFSDKAITGEHAAGGGGVNEEDEEDEEDEDDKEVIVHLENIHKTYLLGVEGVPALRGVTLSIFRGEWLAIYGTSGGGKTTMLNIIGTIDKPTKGEMTVGDVIVNPDTKDHELASIRLNTLGFVFQTFNLLSAMTARENVELPMVLKGEKSAKERRLLAEASLNKMGLSGRMDHHPNMLSGGEQQRVTIARAIANSPDLLLLDEPTGDLDSKNTDMVIKMLDKLNREEGMTLVMVTHDMYLKNFAQRVVWMRDGKIARVETISKKKREEAFRELESNSKVQLSDVSTVPSAHDGGISNVSTLTGTEGWSHTEVRDPSTYRMFAKKSPDSSSSAAAATTKAKKKKTKTT